MDVDAQRKQLEADAKTLGVGLEQLLAAIAEEGGPPAGDYAIWPDNVQTVEVFLSCSQQWRWMGGFGGALCTGLDYAAVEAAMRMMGIKRKRRRGIFEGIHVMEQAALEATNNG